MPQIVGWANLRASLTSTGASSTHDVPSPPWSAWCCSSSSPPPSCHSIISILSILDCSKLLEGPGMKLLVIGKRSIDLPRVADSADGPRGSKPEFS